MSRSEWLAVDLLGGPFDTVLDVGGNVGDFAEHARLTWPDAWVTSFEPLPELAELQTIRAAGRWAVEEVAISSAAGTAIIQHCLNQPSASSMQPLGRVREESFGLRDRLVPVEVVTRPLDHYLDVVTGSALLKVDVEGHELEVLLGAGEVLARCETVVVEVQNDPAIFLGSPAPGTLDALLGGSGFRFAGLAGAFLSPAGRPLQFDAIYRREP